MAFRLPPLSSLRVFEAAARHASFRKAAEELNLTASAVSHGVQTLESWLGVELFHRETRGLRLTAAGEAYAPLVNQALTVLAKASEQLPGRKATGTLSVSAAPTFAHKILLPRLDRFAMQFPDIRVRIDTSQRLVDLTLDDFDIAIRFAPMKKPGPNWTLLAMDTLVPVCSPRFREQLTGPLDASLLARVPLIHVTVTADWAHWFRLNGLEVPPSIDDGLRVDTMQMAADAAIRGFGVALGRRPLIDDDLEDGRLVPLFAEALPSGNGYWLVTGQSDFQKPEVKLFKRWILSEFGAETEHKPARSSARTAATGLKSSTGRPKAASKDEGPKRGTGAQRATRNSRQNPRA
jgi:LysR family transcriptional regulator, glycine cleavage system transcriptional activator